MEGATPLVNVGTLVSGLIIAGTTGLFWFAYTHPRSYMRVSLIVLMIVGTANLVSVGIAIGYRNGAEHAFQYAELPDPKPAFEADPVGWMPMLVFGGLTLLILLLQFIHKLKDD